MPEPIPLSEPFSPDLPELRLMAQLAGVARSRIVAAFNDPPRMLEHLTLEELARLKGACDLVAALMDRMTSCTAIAVEVLQKKGFTHARS